VSDSSDLRCPQGHATSPSSPHCPICGLELDKGPDDATELPTLGPLPIAQIAPSERGWHPQIKRRLAAWAFVVIIILVIVIVAVLHRHSLAPSVADSVSAGSGTTESVGSNDGSSGSDGTSTGSEAGVPLATTTLSSTGERALTIVQNLATALAAHNWDEARAIMPTISQDDGSLDQEYGGLNQSTVVVTVEQDNGPTTLLSGSYVAWETVSGNQQTSLYCTAWSVDPGSNQVVSATAQAAHSDYQSGWVNPSDLTGAIQALCGQ
jgi:hypothetical protein